MPKVLVAEDEPENRERLQRTLTTWGYEVVPAANGFQAVRALLVDPEIRLALVDRAMPGMDGFKVCRVIRSLDRFVYAILMFSDEREDTDRALEAGASDWIAQPLDDAHLRELLVEGERRASAPPD